MKILLNAVGSHGDVLPLIAMGRELLRRGYRPHLFANGAFETMAQEAGLPFSATGAADDLARLLKDRDASDPRKGMSLMARVVMQGIRQTYPLLCREYEPGDTIAVGTSLGWATRLLSETHAAPVAVVHLAPSWFRSEHVAPSLGPLGHLERTPRWLKRWLFAGMDKRFLDPLFTAPLNQFRAELGLAPVQRSFHAWIHQADAVLGMFPEWFGARQPDWPPQLQLTGFPLYDHGNAAELPAAVSAFLAAGEAPVLVTAGTATQSQSAFFDASIQACQRSGHRAILLTQDATQLPSTLPAGMAHFPYVPFQALLPKVAALIHHGGIGTTSQAMRAGVPQLIRPMGFDQFDNALRAMRLGVARQLLPRRYGPESAAAAIRALTTSEEVRTRCREVAGRLGQGGGVDAACDAVLRLRPEPAQQS
jgi:rhamnosyltransferase subunit B